MTDAIAQLEALLYGPGEPAMGYAHDIDQAIAQAQLSAPGKPFCLVQDWRIIEVQVDEQYREALKADRLSPHVLYAATVVMHSAGKRAAGDWVRSTFLRSFSQGFLFETQHTNYMLLGAGVRIKGSSIAVLAIGR